MNNIIGNKKELSPGQREDLLRTLTARFENNVNRHENLQWAKECRKNKLPQSGTVNGMAR